MAGQPLAFEGQGLRTLKIAAKLDAGPQRVALTDTTIGLDEIQATGELVADLSGAVPKLTGNLDLGAVDLDPYLPPPAEGASDSTSRPARRVLAGRTSRSRCRRSAVPRWISRSASIPCTCARSKSAGPCSD